MSIAASAALPGRATPNLDRIYSSMAWTSCISRLDVSARLIFAGASSMPSACRLKGPVILAANHASFLDPPLVGSGIHRGISIISRAKPVSFSRLGWLLRTVEFRPGRSRRRRRGGFESDPGSLARGRRDHSVPRRHPARAMANCSRPVPASGLTVIKSTRRSFRCASSAPTKLGPALKFPRPRRVAVKYGEPMRFEQLRGSEDLFQGAIQALRQAVAPGDGGIRSTKGSRENRARRLRRRQPPFRHLGVRPGRSRSSITTDPDGYATRRSRSSPASATSRARPAVLPTRARRRAPGSRRGRTTRVRDLRRHAAPLRLERGGRQRTRVLPGRPAIRARTVPHMGWNDLAVTDGAAIVAGLDGAGRLLRAQLRGRARTMRVVAVADHDGRIVAASSATGGGRPVPPRAQRRAGARLLENALAWSRSA